MNYIELAKKHFQQVTDNTRIDMAHSNSKYVIYHTPESVVVTPDVEIAEGVLAGYSEELDILVIRKHA